MQKEYKYRPLPNIVTIQKSEIDGLGIFATSDIKPNEYIGITHFKDARAEENGLIRTPLGGFLNHSADNNCVLKENPGGVLYMMTSKYINKGEELTLNYNTELCGVGYSIADWG